MRLRICLLLALSILTVIPTYASGHHIVLKNRIIILDGKRAEVTYRSSEDLDGDGRKESIFLLDSGVGSDSPQGIVIGRHTGSKWQVITFEDISWVYEMRMDVTDINGDRRMEIIIRGGTADGHGTCSIYKLKGGKLKDIGDFRETKFRDLNHDGIPEVLSTGWISFGFVGDHWLTIYKWNGSGYTDVSRRFPEAYNPVIKDIKSVLHDIRYTDSYGESTTPDKAPLLFTDLYYYLGLAFEYQGELDKARIQYAIALRLLPDYYDAVTAMKRIK